MFFRVRFSLLLTSLLAAPAARVAADLTTALDHPGIVWTPGGDPAWTDEVTADAVQGTSAAVWRVNFTGYAPLPREAWLETTVTGPSVFSFSARFNQNPYLNLSLSLDGEPVEQLRPLRGSPAPQVPAWKPWQRLACFVPDGEHRVKIAVCLGCGAGTLPLRTPAIQVDGVSLRGPDAALAAALDAGGSEWFTSGAPPASLVTEAAEPYDGVDAVLLTDQVSEAWLMTRLQGPLTLEWWQAGTSTLRINGHDAFAGAASWTRQRRFIPPGEVQVRWHFGSTQSTTARSITLDSLTTLPAEALTPAAAVATPQTPTGLEFSSGWSGAASTSAPDGQSLAFVTAGPDTVESLRVPVSGAGILEIDVAQRDRPQLAWMIDDRPAAFDSRDLGGEFTRYRFFIPPGAAWFALTVQPASFRPEQPVTVLVDSLRFTPVPAVSLNDALDEPTLTFSTTPARPWPGQAWANAVDGTDSCPSADTQGGESWLEAEVNGPGLLRFAWTTTHSSTHSFPVTVHLNSQPMRLRIEDFAYDGQQMSGNASIEVRAGSHRVRWVVPQGRAFGYFTLDKVSWHPRGGPNPGGAVLAATHGWMASGRDWVADELVSPLGNGPSLRFGPVESLASTMSNFNETGPTLLIPATGPAIARFRALCDYGSLRVFAPRQKAQTISPAAGVWMNVEVFVPPGADAIELLPSGAGSPTAIWIADFTLTPYASPLPQALSASALEWRTNPQNPWEGTPAGAVAGPYLSGIDSWLETTVHGPCLVDYQVTGIFTLTVNGVATALPYISDSSMIRPGALFFPPGAHTLRWTDQGGYLCRLRNFVISPMTGIPQLTREGNSLRFLCPRPQGVTDAQLRPQLAYDPGANFYNISPPGLFTRRIHSRLPALRCAGSARESENVPPTALHAIGKT
jgi:hypothetical protein